VSLRRITRLAFLAVLTAWVATGCSRVAPESERKAWSAELARLQAEQDSLRARAAELVAADPRLTRIPEGDVVISVPTSFVRTVVVQLFDQVAESVTLRLGGIKAHVAKPVKKIVTLGEFVLDVDIREVVGKLTPGTPNVDFSDDRIGMRLPIALSEGTGTAVLHFVWNGKNVADLTCGDLDITRTLSANVVPANYEVTGSLGLAVLDNRVVCSPRFPPTKLRIRVAPTKKSWQEIDKILEEKHGVCGFVLDKVKVPEILERIVQEKGFNVALPFSKLKPFTVPAGVSDSVEVGSRTLAVETTTKSIRVESDAILYSADATLR
jgi:hypothetical protein